MNDDSIRTAFHGYEQIPLREYAERAYLDYSMYVVLDRCPALHRRRVEAGAAAHRLRDERTGPGRLGQAEEIARAPSAT